MKTNKMNIFWGIVLIVAGGLFLAQNFGFLPLFSEQFWMAAFGVTGLLFLIAYFINGVRNWGLLFPACIFSAISLVIFLSLNGLTSALIGAPIFLAVGIPFIVAYFLDRQENWWALIPAYVMVALAVLTGLIDFISGEIVATLILLAIALPFFVVYGLDRTRKWALIPGGVLAGLSIIPLIAMLASGELVGALIVLVVSVPFFVVYFWSKDNWWALIPAGILASVSLALLVAGLGHFAQWTVSLMNGIMFLGWGLTFLALWLRRGSQPTAWAIYPAACLGAAAFLSFLVGPFLRTTWPILLIVGGGFLVWLTLRPKKLA